MIFLITILLSIVFAGAVYFVLKLIEKESFKSSLGLSLFLIRIPKRKAGGTPESDLKSEIGRFEQLLSNLSAIKKPFVFEVAVPCIGEEIHFYLAVPKKWSEIAVKQVHGLWNDASVDLVVDDYTIFNPVGTVAAAYVLQKENYALPIRTYRELEADSFAAILGGFSRVDEVGEGAAIQLIVKEASSGIKKRINNYLLALKKGESFKKITSHQFPVDFSELGNILNPKDEEKKERIIDEETIKALEAKISKPLFEVNFRIVSSAGTPFAASDILDGLAAGLAELATPTRNSFKIVKPRNLNKLIYNFTFRNFDSSQTMILSSEEIASLYHFPTSFTETPKIKWLKAKEAPPPDNLPSSGVIIGESVFRGVRRKVCITREDRRRHIYLIGQTGTGKSTEMMRMAISDIENGMGIAMIDPHGDLVETVLGYIPKERWEDLIYFDPADVSRPLGLNMLEYNFNRPEEKTFIVNEMQGIFNRLFAAETMGPMFEQYMRNALLLLMEDAPNSPSTLVEVPRVFTDTAWREEKLSRIRNPVVVDFWRKEAAKAGGDFSLANMAPYITSKFNNFISNDYIRPIIGQVKSAFNFREAMDSGKIILINLSKGRIGDINAGLLGMIFTGKILMAALSRVDLPSSQRRDFNLYIDEFQNFTTDSIATILSEARKYSLSLVMAHQFIAQLTEKIRDAVFGNVGSQIIFRVGAQDAEFLVKQLEPVFDENDLLNIDNFNAYVKILINGQTARPFNIRTLPPLPFDEQNQKTAQALRDYSRLKYGKNRQVIEAEIYKRLRN